MFYLVYSHHYLILFLLAPVMHVAISGIFFAYLMDLSFSPINRSCKSLSLIPFHHACQTHLLGLSFLSLPTIISHKHASPSLIPFLLAIFHSASLCKNPYGTIYWINRNYCYVASLRPWTGRTSPNRGELHSWADPRPISPSTLASRESICSIPISPERSHAQETAAPTPDPPLSLDPLPWGHHPREEAAPPMLAHRPGARLPFQWSSVALLSPLFVPLASASCADPTFAAMAGSRAAPAKPPRVILGSGHLYHARATSTTLVHRAALLISSLFSLKTFFPDPLK